MLQLTTVVKNLLIINILMFLACQVFPQIEHPLIGYYFSSPYFRPWQPITSMFLHANLMHIFFNMYALVIFGPALEGRMGSKRFLTYYMISGIGAFLLHQGINHIELTNAVRHLSSSEFYKIMKDGPELLANNARVPEYEAKVIIGYFTGVLGASGAVFGILLAFGILFSEVRLQLLFPPVALKAKWMVMIYGAIELYSALQNAPDDNVAHYAHLGGMIFGYVTLKIWQKQGKIY
jgi:membrane associated rhomboid family serine protease